MFICSLISEGYVKAKVDGINGVITFPNTLKFSIEEWNVRMKLTLDSVVRLGHSITKECSLHGY